MSTRATRTPGAPDRPEGSVADRCVRARLRAAHAERRPARRPERCALIGFELVLTHWFYLYIPWFFPFVAFAVLVPVAVRAAEPEPREDSGDERRIGELVPTR